MEEIQLFPNPEPVRNLLLAPEQVTRGPLMRRGLVLGPYWVWRGHSPSLFQGAVFAGFSGGIWRVPRANCSIYESCVDCVLAQDPHCAWDPESGTCRLLPTPIP